MYASPRKDNDIHCGEAMLPKTNRFANESLEAVAVYGTLDILLAEHKADSGSLQAVIASQGQ